MPPVASRIALTTYHIQKTTLKLSENCIMFRFEYPIYLYLLILIPILVLMQFLMVYQQKKRLRRFGDINLVRELMPNVSRHRPRVKFILLIAALALMIVMLARPQMGTKINHEKRTG